MKIEPWPRHYCEHSEGRAYCARRGRWLVDGVVMCGTHKRRAEEQESSRRIARWAKDEWREARS